MIFIKFLKSRIHKIITIILLESLNLIKKTINYLFFDFLNYKEIFPNFF